MTWYANCVIQNKAYREAGSDVDPAVAGINAPTNGTVNIIDTKLRVPVVPLSTEDGNSLLQQLKTEFKRTFKCTKYRSDMSNQMKNRNYLIDPTFNKVNRLSVLSFENEDNRLSYSKYYTSTVETKDCNVLTDGKSFLDILIKNMENMKKSIWKHCRNEEQWWSHSW